MELENNVIAIMTNARVDLGTTPLLAMITGLVWEETKIGLAPTDDEPLKNWSNESFSRSER